MSKVCQFEMDVEVIDVEALFNYALLVAIEYMDGASMTREDALELVEPEDRIDVSACLIMILDPSTIPGRDIQASEAEELEVHQVNFGDERN